MISNLSKEDVAKYHYFVELSQLDSSTKPCPQCSLFTTLKEHNSNRSEHKFKVRSGHRRRSTFHLLHCYKIEHMLFFPSYRSNVAIANSCGALNATPHGIMG